MKNISASFLFVIFFSFFSKAQSLENMHGIYYVEQDSIVHSYEFTNNKKLIVRLNLNDPYKVQFVYKYWYILNDDKTLKVVLINISTEDIDNKNKKPTSCSKHDLETGYFFSIWTLEKIEDNNLYIKVIPSSIKWPFSKGHLANYYSGFEEHFILRPKNELNVDMQNDSVIEKQQIDSVFEQKNDSIVLTEEQNGDKDSQFKMGLKHYNLAYNEFGLSKKNKENRKRNLDASEQWFVKAADQGHDGAKFYLAYLFSKNCDYKCSIESFENAAHNGIAEAQYFLGNFYAKGQSPLSKDLSLAYKWLILSAKSDYGRYSIVFDLINHYYISHLEISKGQKMAKEHVEKYGVSRGFYTENNKDEN